MAKTTLTISSKNYSSWSLRGWLLTKFSGLEFEEVVTAPDDASARAEILLLSSSILVPCLRHDGATVWDTLAIAEYLNEVMPDAGLLPAGPHPARPFAGRSAAKSIPASPRCAPRCRST
jgi:glutathione S-transferase